MPGLREKLTLRLVPLLGCGLIRLLGWTMRMRVLQAGTVEALRDKGQNFILAFWHGQQLMIPLVYGAGRVTILISRHRDGELIARTVRRFGYEAARGSTTRGGAAALRGLVRAGRAGRDLAVTPDGPRGPRHRVQAGVVELAKLTGCPIVPLAFGASKKKYLSPGMVF